MYYVDINVILGWSRKCQRNRGEALSSILDGQRNQMVEVALLAISVSQICIWTRVHLRLRCALWPLLRACIGLACHVSDADCGH